MRLRRSLAGFGTATLLLSATTASAQQIQLSTVVSGLMSPVFVGNADDGSNRLFIVEQAGIIKVLQSGSSTPTVFLDIRSKIVSGGERGLLGLAFHPLYQSKSISTPAVLMPRLSTTRSLAPRWGATRSLRMASAIPGDSASIGPPACNGLATSDRARAKKSTRRS